MFWDPTGKIHDGEIEMYENGEMAPTAYSYLLKRKKVGGKYEYGIFNSNMHIDTSRIFYID